MPLASLPRLAGTTAWSSLPELVVSVMDGRSVWADRYAVQQALAALGDEARTVRIVPSTSLMFLPYTVEGEDLPAGFQFAREKARTLAAWGGTLPGAGPEPTQARARHLAEWAPWKPAPRARTCRGPGGPRPAGLPDRPSAHCPRPPTCRQLRVKLGRGEIDEAAYDAEITRLIHHAIRWQEKWASTSWSTASSSGPTWSSTSRSRWTATTPPRPDGCPRTAADAARRSSPPRRPSASR